MNPTNVTEYEIHEATSKGRSYKYAIPKGLDHNHGWSWAHRDELEVRDEMFDVQPGDVFYDIGAAVGSYTLTALACGAYRCVGINPCAGELDCLRESLRVNAWDNVDLYPVGVYSSRGWLNDGGQRWDVHAPDGQTGFRQETDDSYSFEVTSLDALDFKPESERRVICKIDIEGAEVEAIKGGDRFFREVRPAFVLIENHQNLKPHLEINERLDAAMRHVGYVKTRERPYCQVVHMLYVPKELANGSGEG